MKYQLIMKVQSAKHTPHKIVKKYGADAVKLQTYKPETMTLNSKKIF